METAPLVRPTKLRRPKKPKGKIPIFRGTNFINKYVLDFFFFFFSLRKVQKQKSFISCNICPTYFILSVEVVGQILHKKNDFFFFGSFLGFEPAPTGAISFVAY